MSEVRPGDSVTAIYVAEAQTGLLGHELTSAAGLEIVAISRTLDEFAEATRRMQPDLAIVDTASESTLGFEAIPIAFAQSPDIAVLIRTPDPAPHNQVARAMRAGALGFVSSASSTEELVEAARAVVSGQPWLPASESRELLASVGDGGELTTAQREAKLKTFVISLVPLAGGLSAIMSLLWRRYMGQIGVRPVDLAIDPTSRIVDGFFALSVLAGVFGSLLFVRTWLGLVDADRTPRLKAWVSRHRRASVLFLGWAVLTSLGLLAVYAQIVVALFIGPTVAALVAAQLFDLDDSLPRFMRPRDLRSRRTAVRALLIVLGCLTILSAEVLIVGPAFDETGAKGFFAPTVLGFGAQPMTHITVDGSRAPKEVLYLGGNADLYVLVDVCNGDEVEFISVGSSQLIAIDEVRCP